MMQTEMTTNKRNERTCAGCSKHADAGDCVRVVVDPSSGELAVDIANSEFGRGAHVHPSVECITKALKGGFAKVFKTKVVGDAKAIGDAIVAGADRRLEGLLTGARRAGQLAVGTDSVVDALKNEKARVVLVARDAAAAIRVPEIERAIGAGKAIAFADKERLGVLMKREEVAVVAVLHDGVATAIADTHRVSMPFRSQKAWSSSEVR